LMTEFCFNPSAHDGKAFWQNDSAWPKHSRWRMTFADGNVFLIDPRRFGTIKIVKKVESESAKDIFKEFNLKAFLKTMEAVGQKLNR